MAQTEEEKKEKRRAYRRARYQRLKAEGLLPYQIAKASRSANPNLSDLSKEKLRKKIEKILAIIEKPN